MEEEIKSNTTEIIKIDKMFVNDVKELKQKYLEIKSKIYNEIIQEINEKLISNKTKTL